MRFPRLPRRQNSARISRPGRRLFGPDPLEPRTMMAADVRMTAAAAAAQASSSSENVSEATSESVDARFVHWITGALVDVPLSDQVESRLLQRIERGGSRRQAVAFVLRTPSGRQAAIDNSFDHLLDRAPTAIETRRLLARGGVDQSVVIRQILASREYFVQHGGGTNAGYVAAIVDDMLETVPSQAQIDHWVRSLDRGMPRIRFVAAFQRSDIYVHSTARQLARRADRTEDDAALIRQVELALRGPQPLTMAKAVVFGSDAFLERFESEPTTSIPASSPVSEDPGIPPRFSLTTQWNNLPLDSIAGINAWGASPGGDLWVGTHSTLYVYRFASKTFDTVVGDSIYSVSPISDTEAWIIGSEGWQNTRFLAMVDTQGNKTTVANLPGGDNPSLISAAPDGTVMVLGSSGSVYSYDSGTNAWSQVPTDGYTILNLSVGSASNIWAIGQNGSGAVLLRYEGAKGWTPDASLAVTVGSSVAATSDGYVWAMVGPHTNQAYTRQKDGSWYLVPNQSAPGSSQPIPTAIAAIVAPDKNRMFGYSFAEDGGIVALSLGLLDQPLEPLPQVTDQWDIGYAAINAYFGVQIEGGVRALYDSVGTTFTEWQGDLQHGYVPQPEGITDDNWTTITKLIAAELGNAFEIMQLYSQLIAINEGLEQAYLATIGPAVTNVDLSVTEQSTDILELAIVALADAAVAGIAAAFSGGASIVAAIVASVVQGVIGDVTGQHDPDVKTDLKQTYVALSDTLNTMFGTVGSNLAANWSTAVSDPNVLASVGEAVHSGLWYLPGGAAADYEAAAVPSFNRFFYQAFMPAKWEIIYIQGLECDLYHCSSLKVPSYDVYEVEYDNPTGKSNYIDVWYVLEAGSKIDPYRSDGTFPEESLLNTIWTLPTAKVDFFTGSNGWKLKQIQVRP
jgi:hypothetical protein